jgi:hypothetical protein
MDIGKWCHASRGLPGYIALAVAIMLAGNNQLAAQTFAGCDYWENHSISDLDTRLDRARQEYFSIPAPTRSDLEEQYQITWKEFEARGYNPAEQMRGADEFWLTRLYMSRKYEESFPFAASQQEIWVFCLDTRQGNKTCKDIQEAHGALTFDAKGQAVDPPPAFVSYYENSQYQFFEHVLLAMIIVDALPACDESDEATKLADKALQYLKEFQSGRRP